MIPEATPPKITYFIAASLLLASLNLKPAITKLITLTSSRER